MFSIIYPHSSRLTPHPSLLTLQPLQMEALIATVEEELNFSKKQSRSRIKNLMEEADLARRRRVRGEGEEGEMC